MRIDEIGEREDLNAVLRTTLRDGWSRQFGVPVTLGDRGAQPWLVHPILSAYFTRDASPRVRAFLRDSLRYTPHRVRRVPQWIAATLLVQRPLLFSTARPAFAVDPPLRGAADRLVVPGNRRIRTFDFATGTTRVFLKTGFSASAITDELEARRDPHAPAPPVIKSAADEGWFEERIVAGFTLPRCPPFHDRRAYELRARRALADWSTRSRARRPLGPWLGALEHRIRDGLNTLRHRLPSAPLDALANAVAPLVRAAGGLDDIEVAKTHGDFQAGNILVDPAANLVFVIDWEFAGIRMAHYDAFVFSLGTRSARGLAERIGRFVERGTSDPFLPRFSSADQRRAHVAAFLLDDLAWHVSEAAGVPLVGLPRGLRTYVAELSVLGPGLARVFGGRK